MARTPKVWTPEQIAGFKRQHQERVRHALLSYNESGEGLNELMLQTGLKQWQILHALYDMFEAGEIGWKNQK